MTIWILAIDKEVFVSMLKEYQTKVDKKYLPAMYDKIDTLYNGISKPMWTSVCNIQYNLFQRFETFLGTGYDV